MTTNDPLISPSRSAATKRLANIPLSDGQRRRRPPQIQLVRMIDSGPISGRVVLDDMDDIACKVVAKDLPLGLIRAKDDPKKIWVCPWVGKILGHLDDKSAELIGMDLDDGRPLMARPTGEKPTRDPVSGQRWFPVTITLSRVPIPGWVGGSL